MFAAIIKNTILIFFVICIGYFLVDNHLNEMKLEQSSKDNDNNDNDNDNDKKTSKKENIVGAFLKRVKEVKVREDEHDDEQMKLKESEKQQQQVNQTNMRIVIDPELKELYNYVFNDSKANDDLNSIFTKTEVKNVEKDHQILCEKDQKEEEKMANMCSNPIDEHHKNVSYDHIETKALNDQSVYDFVDKHI